MFERSSCNMKPLDSMIRFILVGVITIYALYVHNYYYLIMSFIIFYTAVSKFCFVYYFLHVNERFSKKNYFLSFLPKYNPSAVFIFDKKGDLIFKNETAEKEFSSIDSIRQLHITQYEELITNDTKTNVLFNEANKNFKIELVGVSKENFLLAYVNDVTQIYALNEEIEGTQREVIYAMGEIGETRSKETGNHVKRVANYSYELAILFGLSEAEANKLKMASPMHDIGKVGIPDAILNAPRKLTEDEFEVMKTHANLGYNMLKNSTKPILQAAAIVANEHHEKYDGSGYPAGKAKEDIHIYARITAVADVFDALGSERVYKKAWEFDKIAQLFEEQKGKHFDPKLVDLFFDNIEIFLKIRDTYQDTK